MQPGAGVEESQLSLGREEKGREERGSASLQVAPRTSATITIKS